MQEIGSSKQLLVQFESSPAIEENAKIYKIVAKWPDKTDQLGERQRGFVLVGRFTEGILSIL